MKLSRPELWTAPQRGVLIALFAGILVYLVVRLAMNPAYVADPQPRVPDRALDLEDRIDPNTADWPTLAALPTIGEKRARDIVEYREQYLSERPGEIAFAHPSDLQRVRGIGPATMTQMEPYLIFPATRPTTIPIAPASVGEQRQ